MPFVILRVVETSWLMIVTSLTLTKVSADLSDTQPEANTGSFLNEETGATNTIEHIYDVNFSLTVSDLKSYDKKLLRQDLMLAGTYRLNFPDESADHDNFLLLDGDRIKQVEFKLVTGYDN